MNRDSKESCKGEAARELYDAPGNRRCPVCGGTHTMPILYRVGVPVHQNLLFTTAEAARGAARGVLDLHVCKQCSFLFNAGFDARLLEYGGCYENTQTWSAVFDGYVNDLVRLLVEENQIRKGRVIEIGCGKGDFLRKLLCHQGNECEGVGFDPSYCGPDTSVDGRARFVRAFYVSDTALPGDVFICRHVIEHVVHPLQLLRTLRNSVASFSQVMLFLETPCAEWILRNQVVWDLFYEHCSLFTRHSLNQALNRAGFQAKEIRHVFGGQYLWAEAACAPSEFSNENDLSLIPLAERFSREQQMLISRWAALVTELLAAGPVAVWGAGAKGATFCNLIDPNARLLAAAIDINPAKQGMFIGGTGHRILAPLQVAEEGIRAVLVPNPNYVPEVAQMLSQLNAPTTVIDLMATGGKHASHH